MSAYCSAAVAANQLKAYFIIFGGLYASRCVSAELVPAPIMVACPRWMIVVV